MVTAPVIHTTVPSILARSLIFRKEIFSILHLGGIQLLQLPYQFYLTCLTQTTLKESVPKECCQQEGDGRNHVLRHASKQRRGQRQPCQEKLLVPKNSAPHLKISSGPISYPGASPTRASESVVNTTTRTLSSWRRI